MILAYRNSPFAKGNCMVFAYWLSWIIENSLKSVHMKKQGNLMCHLSGTVFLCSCHPYTLHVWPSSVHLYRQAVRGVFLESGLPLSLWPLVCSSILSLFISCWMYRRSQNHLFNWVRGDFCLAGPSKLVHNKEEWSVWRVFQTESLFKGPWEENELGLCPDRKGEKLECKLLLLWQIAELIV